MKIGTANRLTIDSTIEAWPFARPVRITGYIIENADVIVITLSSSGGCVGRGEACGIYYKNETARLMKSQVDAICADRGGGLTRKDLLCVLPPGGARNALDCAFWELESKIARIPAWRLAEAPKPKPLLTTYTIGADDPETMADGAKAFAVARALKLKLLGDGRDADRVAAVRRVRPDVWLGVDANGGFSVDTLKALIPVLERLDVRLIEQPLPAGREEELRDLRSPIPFAADESVQEPRDIARLHGLFDVINIKLDKCGGLTTALEMVREARRLGMKVMVGNMGGTSLSMFPAFILGQFCDLVDLDGPLLLKQDRIPGVSYRHGMIWCDESAWSHAS